MRILIADDDPSFRLLLEKNIRNAGFETVTATCGTDALSLHTQGNVDMVVSDIQMPGMDGIELLAELRRRDPLLPVVLVTAHATVESAIKAVQLGAYDYVRKPTDLEKLPTVLKNALAHRQLSRRVAQLEEALDEKYSRSSIVGESRAMQRVFSALEKVIPSAVPVLLTGESGTGKEMLAKAVHFGGPRRKGPFVAVNCAAIPEGLMESELFGHEKGAFTGAHQRRAGKFEQAASGTLLLDEIGDLALPLQAKLLRALQEKEIERVGGGAPIRVDVRIIAATHQDLSARVRSGAFREDLFYRLNVFPIQLPPLRERPEDIPVLAKHFLEKFNRQEGRSLTGFSPDAMDVLCSQQWPGNVRELENRIFRAGLLAAGDEISIEDIEGTYMAATPDAPRAPGQTAISGSVARDLAATSQKFPTMEEIERDAIERALEASGGNVAEAARLLDLGKATLYRKIRQFGLKALGEAV